MNWTRDGWVVLNGEGVDIFFSLEKAKGSGQSVITDQRKFESKALGTSKLHELDETARITPTSEASHSLSQRKFARCPQGTIDEAISKRKKP